MIDPPAPRPAAICVRVPATSGNLGPGFDVLGLAYTLYNTFQVRTTAAGTLQIQAEGDLPTDRTNLFYRAFAALCHTHDRPVPGLDIRMDLRIPAGRGLGSSATAVVGGLQAANALLGLGLTAAALLPHAVALEHGRHPDNVAPALLGGLVVNTFDGPQLLNVPLPFPADIQAVVYIPDFAMDTVQGRALMPTHYTQADVVFNTSRVALLLAALSSGQYRLLGPAMEDRMHQPYRAQLFPALPDLLAAARAAGAYGACLSGGGSTILALTAPGPPAQAVAAALCHAAARAGLTGSAQILDIDRHGATVTDDNMEPRRHGDF
ncbi:MAG: homoserine kinase [Chloroflexota bacterium]|nr:homoserine kinase [Chloroflexota bacterium]